MPWAGAADVLDTGQISGLQIMGESVDMPVPAAEGARPAHLAKLATLKNPRFVAFLFGGTIALQAVGYLILGTGRPGRDFSAIILCFQNFLAVACGIS
jgi:hypothetical protein